MNPVVTLVVRLSLPWMLLTGCAFETEAPPAEPSVEVGTGTWRFEPLEEGQGVDLIRGAQGGWHMWVALRTTGIEQDRVHLALESQPADDSRPAQHTELDIFLDPPDAEGRRSYLGWPEIIADASCTVGALVRVNVRISDDAGLALEDERYVTAMEGADPPPACAPAVPPPSMLGVTLDAPGANVALPPAVELL